MNINSNPGDKVVFIGNGGYPGQVHSALNDGLIFGNEYTIDSIDSGSFYTSVFLRGFPNIPFNSAMFDNLVTIDLKPHEVKTTSNQKFEYMIKTNSSMGRHYDNVVDTLNNLSKEGWELVAVDNGDYIFKKEIL